MVCLFLFLFLFCFRSQILDLKTCYVFQISQYLSEIFNIFLKILGNPWISVIFLRISSANIVNFKFVCIFVLHLNLAGVFLCTFVIFWHVCIFYPCLEVYNHVLGICYNFTNQDFVVFPVSATTSLVFCRNYVHTAQPVKFLVYY